MVTTYLDQLVEPFAECLTPEAARRIVDLRASESLQSQVTSLSEKANLGTLTEAEKEEYDRYLAAYHFATIVQARTRKLLKW